MRRLLWITASVLVVGSAFARTGDVPFGRADGTATTPTCVKSWGEARYRIGYDHIVTIDNGCTFPVACDVRTNVNPDNIRVDVPAGAREEVLTFRGSPASEFQHTVACVPR